MPPSHIGIENMVKPRQWEPAAIIPTKIIDSFAYASLKHATTRVLTIIVRQYNGKNNGQLQATYTYCKPRGIGSQNTLKEAISELISRGLIVRTRSRGTANGKNIWALYAITWRKPDKSNGINLDGFVMDAWAKWTPEKNSGSQKVQKETVKNCNLMAVSSSETSETRPSVSDTYE
ncbi:MAG: hypothetical protein ACOYBR_00730 [Fluviibacter sp.]